MRPCRPSPAGRITVLNVSPAITQPPTQPQLTHLSLVVGVALSPNSFLNPPLLDLESPFGFALLALLVCCCCGVAVCLASSFGEELDFRTEDGRSASAGEGLGFGLETDGGDFVKKLKRELCFAMSATLKAVVVGMCEVHPTTLFLHHLAYSYTAARAQPSESPFAGKHARDVVGVNTGLRQ